MTIYAGQVRHGTHGEATATPRPTKTIPMLSEARSLINARTLYLVSTPPTPTDESSCFSKTKKAQFCWIQQYYTLIYTGRQNTARSPATALGNIDDRCKPTVDWFKHLCIAKTVLKTHMCMHTGNINIKGNWSSSQLTTVFCWGKECRPR